MGTVLARFLLIFLYLCARFVSAQSAAPRQPGKQPDRAQQVLAVDEARRRAMLTGDIKTLDSVLADDVTIVWGDGTTDNKSSALELFRSGRIHYAQSDYENTRVRLFGETAVVTGDARVKATSDGHTLAYLVRVTRVYVYQQRQWRLVAVQTTRVGSIP